METEDPGRPERFAAGALFVASAAGVVAMAFHPTGRDLLHGTHRARAAMHTQVVHAVAIAVVWLQVVGLSALLRRVRRPAFGVAELAWASQLLAAVAGTHAAVASGFVAPRIGAAMPPMPGIWELNGMLNQAYAQLFAIAVGIATALFSYAAHDGSLPRWLRGLGMLLGPALVAAIATGTLRLSVHGMGVLVLLQAVWHTGVGVVLCRPSRR